jgi:lysophospholipase L1-like esterase
MTAGFPCYEPYAKSLISTLEGEGIFAEVVGCGLCGLTAVEMARGLDSEKLKDNFGRVGLGLRRLLEEQGPFDLVMIMAGTNDLAFPEYSSKKVLESLKSMHKACWEKGVPTVALSVPESCVTGSNKYPDAAKKWHKINDALAEWASAEEGEHSLESALFVNTATLVSFNKEGRKRGLWEDDSLHFTAAGSREFGSKLAPVVASHLQTQTEDCESDNDSEGTDNADCVDSEDPKTEMSLPEKSGKVTAGMKQKLKKFLSKKRASLKRTLGLGKAGASPQTPPAAAAEEASTPVSAVAA